MLSECDEGIMGECTIKIVQEDKLQVVNHKQKFVKQASLRFSPFDFGEDTDWDMFLDKVAVACEASRDALIMPSLCWKFFEACQLIASPPLQYRRVHIPQEEAHRHPADDFSDDEATSGCGFSKTGMFLLISLAHPMLICLQLQAWAIGMQTGEPNQLAMGN